MRKNKVGLAMRAGVEHELNTEGGTQSVTVNKFLYYEDLDF